MSPQATDAVRTIRPERRAYSRNPWRLVDSLDGNEVAFPVEFDHPMLGKTTIATAGFPTKAAALERLGEMAAVALELVSQEARP